MKRLYLLIIPAVLFVLGGCATPVDIAKSEPATVLHNDLTGAANVDLYRASQTTDPQLKAAYQARAQWWMAADNMMTARENQASVCLNAAQPVIPSTSGIPVPTTHPHLATDFEIAAGVVANLNGLSPAMKLACEPVVIPTALGPIPGLK